MDSVSATSPFLHQRALEIVTSQPELAREIRDVLDQRDQRKRRPRKMSLTPIQRNTLSFIRDYIADNDGMGPSYDEIMNYLGLASKSGVHRIVVALEERGHIQRIPFAARAIKLVDDKI